MKRIFVLFLSVCCALVLFSCTETEQNNETTINYIGEHECFTISDVSFTLNEDGRRFEGGKISFHDSSLSDSVSSYSYSFYTLRTNGERNAFHGQTGSSTIPGESVSLETNLGISASNSRNMIIGLEQGLWFELKITKLDGTEIIYTIQLTIVE